MTSNFAAALAKAGGLAETAKLGEYDLQLAHPAVSPLIPIMTLLLACVSSLKTLYISLPQLIKPQETCWWSNCPAQAA